MQTDPFQANPLGRGQLAVFRSGSRRTRSSRIDLDLLVVTASPARTALKISQLTDGGMPPTCDSMHYCPVPEISISFVAIKMGRRVRDRSFRKIQLTSPRQSPNFADIPSRVAEGLAQRCHGNRFRQVRDGQVPIPGPG